VTCAQNLASEPLIDAGITARDESYARTRMDDIPKMSAGVINVG
jgi:hypothetical protein